MSSELRIGNETTGLLLKEALLQDTTGTLKALVIDTASGEVKYYKLLPNLTSPDGTYDIQNIDKPFIVNINDEYFIGKINETTLAFTGFDILADFYNYIGRNVQIYSETAIISHPNKVLAHVIEMTNGAKLMIRTDGLFDIDGGIKSSLDFISGIATMSLSNRYYICEAPVTSITLPTFPALELNKFLGITFTIMNRSGQNIDLMPNSPITKIEGVEAIYSIPNNTNIEVILTGSTNGWRISSKSTI